MNWELFNGNPNGMNWELFNGNPSEMNWELFNGNPSEMNWEHFSRDLNESLLFEFYTTSTEEYGCLLNQSMVTIFHNHSPIHTRTIRQSPIIQHQLSIEALEARNFRRKMEKRYFRTSSLEDEVANAESKLKAGILIMSARVQSVHIKLKSPSKEPQSLQEPQQPFPASKTSTQHW